MQRQKKLSETFLEYLSVERGLSSNTIDAYKRDLLPYSKWLKGDILKADSTLIGEYVARLREKKCAPSSISRKLSVIRTFYRFLYNRTIIMDGGRFIRRLIIGKE